MNRRKEILSKARSVTWMPIAATKLFKLLQDPHVRIRDVTETAELDPGLTADLLRLANSSIYSWARRIGSIQEAVLRLGTDKVFELVVASVAATLAKGGIKGYGLPPGELWRHSVAVAIGACELSAALNLDSSKYTFTSALLHDIGKIVLGTFVQIDAVPITALAFEKNVPFEEAERRVLGIDHAEVGAFLLECWNLPEELVDVVRWHHQPEHFLDEPGPADLVHVADALSMMGGIGTGMDGLNYRLSSRLASRLGLKAQITERVACRTIEKLEEMKGFFKLTRGR
ncbi:MAG: HDOD domain-containing protein [Deltaproteobacteria bacterium]|nr:HDOD domain-containing protein [Deltaproteobacteria bacterium]